MRCRPQFAGAGRAAAPGRMALAGRNIRRRAAGLVCGGGGRLVVKGQRQRSVLEQHRKSHALGENAVTDLAIHSASARIAEM